ncbi:MAG TPA: hypothetical protein PLA50_18920 [Bacteroidia bacterium]|nr:hypothetical protein [Bacteroidia bacterium]
MTDDHHFRREDRSARWLRIARHLAGRPQDLDIALDNIERWLALGRVHPAPLLEWRRRILAAQESDASLREFLELLSRDDCDSEPLKSCSPFAGLPPAPSLTADTLK